MSDIHGDDDDEFSGMGIAPIEKPHEWYGSVNMMKENKFKHIEDKIWFRENIGYVERIPICDDCGEMLEIGQLWIIREGTNEIKIEPGEYCNNCYNKYPHEKGTAEKPLEVVGSFPYLRDISGYSLVEEHPKYLYREDVGLVSYIAPCIACSRIIAEMAVNDSVCKACSRELGLTQ